MLLLAQARGHGYELMERLKPLGFGWGVRGPIYRALRSLGASGSVACAWSAPRAGPVPRVYELTAEGRRALDRCATGVVELTQLLNQFLSRHRSL